VIFDGNLGIFENVCLRIPGIFPAARTTPPALKGSGPLVLSPVGVSPLHLLEDIPDFTLKNPDLYRKKYRN
jgi:hypothetical protein